MLDRDPLFDLMVERGGRRVARCDILVEGVPVETGLPIAAASVRNDRGQFTRRSCDLVIPDQAYIPKKATDPLQPWGTELRLWSGWVLPDGRESLVPVGTFVIWDNEVSDPFAGVHIVGYDRCKMIESARFPYPRVAQAGSLVSRLRSLSVEAVPWADFAVKGVADAAAGGMTYDRDRGQACTDIASALGGEVYADPWGVITIRPVPDPNGPEALTISAAQTMIQATQGMSRQGVYNAMVVSSSSAGLDTPVTAIAVDDDPWSPTYFGGESKLTGRTFGQIPRFFDTPLVSTQRQAQIAANGMLLDVIGLRQTVSVQTMPHAALEPGDVIAVEYSDGSRTRHLAETWTLDLDPESNGMQIDTRSTAYELAGS